jgi:hypothetical protein
MKPRLTRCLFQVLLFCLCWTAIAQTSPDEGLTEEKKMIEQINQDFFTAIAKKDAKAFTE